MGITQHHMVVNKRLLVLTLNPQKYHQPHTEARSRTCTFSTAHHQKLTDYGK